MMIKIRNLFIIIMTITIIMSCMQNNPYDTNLKVFHPNSVHIITFEGKKVDEEIVNSTTTFLSLYVFFIILIMILVSFDGYSFELIINSVFTTFCNVGLAFEVGSFSIFSDFSTFVLTVGMLLGRLEIFPLIGLISSIRK